MLGWLWIIRIAGQHKILPFRLAVGIRGPLFAEHRADDALSAQKETDRSRARL